MAGAIVGLHVFGADTGPEPLSNLDNNFSPLALAINTLNTYSNFYVDSGAANAAVVTIGAAQAAALATGLIIQVQMAAGNTTTAPTLNFNGTGAKTIGDINGSALLPGQLAIGFIATFLYNGTVWCCQNFNNFTPGDPTVLHASKAADTTRSSVVVPANDPDLVIALPYVGRWAFELVVSFYNVLAPASGILSNVNYSAAFTAASSFLNFISFLGTTPAGSNVVGVSATQGVSSNPMNVTGSISATAAAPTGLIVKGTITVTAIGNLAFAWSQATTNAQPLHMVAGSYLMATAIS